MAEFQRASWAFEDKRLTESENTRKTDDVNGAVGRIFAELEMGRELVLPSEVGDEPNQVSLRLADLQGDYSQIIRGILGRIGTPKNEDQRDLRHRLTTHIGFVEGPSKLGGRDVRGASLTPERFYLNQLPYYKALVIFKKDLRIAYFKGLEKVFNNPTERIKAARIDPATYAEYLAEIRKSPKPDLQYYDIAKFYPKKSGFPHLEAILQDDEFIFAQNYITFLDTQFGDNEAAKLAHAGLDAGELKELGRKTMFREPPRP